jgi:ribose/xylose/arabinose/galactoside ABC-type transport system permease subunit
MSLLVQKRLRLPVHWRFNGALILLIVLYAAIVAVQPTFAAPPSIMVFLRRAAPLVVLACGQLPVLLTGGFDLSSGAVVTLTVLGGSMLTDGDPSRTAMAIPLLLLCGVGIGLANGLAVALLRVPSIIATLGSLLMVRGAALMWSGGAPSGYLPDNFRWLGRSMWRDVPLIHLLPAAVPATVIYAAMAALLTHRSILGRLWLASSRGSAQLSPASCLAALPACPTRWAMAWNFRRSPPVSWAAPNCWAEAARWSARCRAHSPCSRSSPC